jgi:hypothetical protein
MSVGSASSRDSLSHDNCVTVASFRRVNSRELKRHLTLRFELRSNSSHLSFSQCFETIRARSPWFGQHIAIQVIRRSSRADIDWDRVGTAAVAGPWFRSWQLPRTWIDKR